MQTPDKTDVFVVGGGPAGLAAAIAARLKGFEVAVADAAHPPIDKACGEGLMPDSLNLFRHLGILPGPDLSFAFRGVRFVADEVSVDASFKNGRGIGIRRLELHRLLVDRARELGVTLLWGTPVSAISREAVMLDGHAVCKRWVIGADGQNSRVRRWAGLDAAHRESFRFGFRRHYRVPTWTDCVEVHWGEGCEVYVTPVSAREVGIALLSADSHARIDSILPSFPELQRRLAGAAFSSTERGAVTASRRLQRVFRGRIALIGDASGSVDAITGEGLCLSFKQAIALADALVADDLARYQTEHRRLVRRPAFIERLLLSLDRSPMLRRHIFQAFAANPRMFANLLAIHVGDHPGSSAFIRGQIEPRKLSSADV